MSKLENKVAIVTGASKGIGASIAKHLAAEGAAVVVNYSLEQGRGRPRRRRDREGGGRAVAVQANVAKQADVPRLFAEAKKAFGRLDILVNNAGIYEFVPLEDITEDHFHKLFDLNVLGLILATQEAVKYFGPEGGSIVNISSVASTSHRRPRRSTAPPRRPSTRSQGRWPRSWARKRSGSIRINPGMVETEGRARRRVRRRRVSHQYRGHNAARAHRPAQRHRACRRVSGVGRFGLDHRRNLVYRGGLR